jgi:hypothetical protein
VGGEGNVDESGRIRKDKKTVMQNTLLRTNACIEYIKEFSHLKLL